MDTTKENMENVSQSSQQNTNLDTTSLDTENAKDPNFVPYTYMPDLTIKEKLAEQNLNLIDTEKTLAENDGIPEQNQEFESVQVDNDMLLNEEVDEQLKANEMSKKKNENITHSFVSISDKKKN